MRQSEYRGRPRLRSPTIWGRESGEAPASGDRLWAIAGSGQAKARRPSRATPSAAPRGASMTPVCFPVRESICPETHDGPNQFGHGRCGRAGIARGHVRKASWLCIRDRYASNVPPTETHIHIVGASGSGTTTLGRALAREIGAAHLDTDDFCWMPTDSPSLDKRPVEQRLSMPEAELTGQVSWMLSCSLIRWGKFWSPFRPDHVSRSGTGPAA